MNEILENKIIFRENINRQKSVTKIIKNCKQTTFIIDLIKLLKGIRVWN